MNRNFLFASLLLLGLQVPGVPEATAQAKLPLIYTSGTMKAPKVAVDLKQRLDYASLTAICQQLAKAYPGLVKVETIGDSYEGRRIWAMTISDFRTGDPDRKPAYYLDGNIALQDEQASEMALYTAWYLLENFKENPFIQELLLQKTFYILPAVYPDAWEKSFSVEASGKPAKSSLGLYDDDGDGLVDEDQPQDLNQDGFITYMRRKSANGKYVADPKNPLKLVRVKPGQKGEFELLGLEGLDNDGDGKVNEDPAGYQDSNSDWAWNWQPDYVQRSASRFPFALPENRILKDFILKHPNIAGAQNYCNTLLTPTNHTVPVAGSVYQQEENQVKQDLEKIAETLLPGFTYTSSGLDWYNAYGGQLEWLRAARGIFTFRNELMSQNLKFNQEFASVSNQDPEQKALVTHPLFQDAFVEWTPFNHPTYGAIEIGGYKKGYSYGSSGIQLEEDAHRNLVSTLFQAYHTPQIEIKDVLTQTLPNGLTEVSATVVNTRLIPTHSTHDLLNKIERPDYITLKDSTVVAGSFQIVGKATSFHEQTYIPAKLEVPTIPGRGAVKVRWVVKGIKPNLEIEVDSRKGGVVCQRF
ncbi:hypothetical protein TH63_07685 [Rufibacter radiotolerans]|uniref:Peptidase M14 domain-containing protein n=1 Tax=Rufibacter radiotolerans TaxID=1379910 RepID=A0A0H4VP95_9BACT|nr:M14 family metallopeptidase [Rufibacter radiotolerans]AKQ45554.1 hypothetical protein TH63_07685 [Rufibacter radiotolerans]